MAGNHTGAKLAADFRSMENSPGGHRKGQSAGANSAAKYELDGSAYGQPCSDFYAKGQLIVTNPSPTPSALGSSLLRDKRLLLYLFVSFRLILLLVHQPLPPYTPGLTGFGDFAYFHGLASLADQGKLPYRDYWFEYPPAVAFVSQGVYSLIQAHGGDFTAYAMLLGIVLTAFDVGNLLLLRRIGTQLHGPGTGAALAWIYALLPAPLIISFWSFDTLVAFFTLLAITWLIDASRDHSDLADARGGLTQLMPLILLGAVWRFRPAGEALRYSLIALGVTAAGLLAMLAFAGPYGLPSLSVQFSKSSAETVWALLDGNYTTGILKPDHLGPATAFQSEGA